MLVEGAALNRVRTLTFDGRGDQLYAVVRQLELQFSETSIVIGTSSYGDLSCVEETLEAFCEDIIEGLEELYVIDDVSATAPWKDFIGAKLVESRLANENDQNAALELTFSNSRKLAIASIEKWSLMFHVEAFPR